MRSLTGLQEAIVSCPRCPRLVAHREEVAEKKRPMYADWEYWGRPVPSFGDPGGRLLTDDQIAETMAVERRDAGEVEQELGAALIGEIPDPARHIRTDVTQTLGTDFQDHDATDEPFRLALHSSTNLATRLFCPAFAQSDSGWTRLAGESLHMPPAVPSSRLRPPGAVRGTLLFEPRWHRDHRDPRERPTSRRLARRQWPGEPGRRCRL